MLTTSSQYCLNARRQYFAGEAPALFHQFEFCLKEVNIVDILLG